jgi:hypothetical protein
MKLSQPQLQKATTYAQGTTHPFNPNYKGGISQFVKPYGKLKAYKKGGKVKKTGPAKVHKGERVLTKKQNAKYEKTRKNLYGLK